MVYQFVYMHTPVLFVVSSSSRGNLPTFAKQRCWKEEGRISSLQPVLQGAGAESYVAAALKVFRGSFVSHYMAHYASLAKDNQDRGRPLYDSEGPLERLCARILPLMSHLIALNLLVPKAPQLPPFNKLVQLELHASEVPCPHVVNASIDTVVCSSPLPYGVICSCYSRCSLQSQVSDAPYISALVLVLYRGICDAFLDEEVPPTTFAFERST